MVTNMLNFPEVDFKSSFQEVYCIQYAIDC
jgi:hypothetical protein